jgi:hypothetical protein
MKDPEQCLASSQVFLHVFLAGRMRRSPLSPYCRQMALQARKNHPPQWTTTLMMIRGRKKRRRLMPRVVVGLEGSERDRGIRIS